MKITVVGMGYVGLSSAMLFAQHHPVIALDIDSNKVDNINRRKPTIKDDYVEEFFQSHDLQIQATLDYQLAYENADYIVIAVPTDYNPEIKSLDICNIEKVIRDVLSVNKQALIVIKSTLPLGGIDKLKSDFNIDNIIYSPEFLREGSALYDTLNPTRVIVGEESKRAQRFIDLIKSCIVKEDVECLLMGSREAEAVKLFSNTYLAMRVTFFNELDSYALSYDLSTLKILAGVCSDPRIGDYYNNPSFGYGGYCLPKDSQQLLDSFEEVPQSLMSAIVSSNIIRMNFIVDMIVKKAPDVIGIYHLTMKSNSDNFRFSAVQYIIESLKRKGKTVIVHEPLSKDNKIFGVLNITDFKEFEKMSDLIVANRKTAELVHCTSKVFSRDVYERD